MRVQAEGFAPLPRRALLFLSRSATINAEPQQVLSARHCSQSDKHEEAEGYARCLLECVYTHTNIPDFCPYTRRLHSDPADSTANESEYSASFLNIFMFRCSKANI